MVREQSLNVEAIEVCYGLGWAQRLRGPMTAPAHHSASGREFAVRL